MKVKYSVGLREHKYLDATTVDFQALLEEPLLSLWSRYGNGQLGIVDYGRSVSLGVDRIGEERFLLDWHGDGRMVPYDGTDCFAFTTIEMCGDPFRVPSACTVDRSAAVQAIAYTAHHGKRDPNLRWVLMDSVPFPEKWYDA